MERITFEKAEETDVEAMLDIYNHYITTSTATFDVGPISKDEFCQRIFLDYGKYCTFLIRYQAKIIGFCFLTQFRKKKAYDRTVEIGVYLSPEKTGRGIGKQAVNFLEKVAGERNIKVIIASISGENATSIKLFQVCGYEECAHYKEVGEKFGRVLDVVDYEKILGNHDTTKRDSGGTSM